MPKPQENQTIEAPEDQEAPEAPPAETKPAEPKEVESVNELMPQDEAAKAPQAGDEEPEPKNTLDNHPRFREVYGKMKKIEREKDELMKDIDAMRNFNRQLASRLGTIEQNKADRPPLETPDFTQDPEAAKAWMQHQLEDERKKIQSSLAEQTREMQVQLMYESHPDYEDVIKLAARDMDRDPELSRKIYSTGNAPKAAYEYGKTKKAELDKSDSEELDRLSRIKQTRVNGAGEAPPVEEEDEKLSEQEMRVVRRLFDNIPEHEAKKKYLAQKKALGGRRS